MFSKTIHHGISPPICINMPTEYEVKLSAALQECLHARHALESDVERHHKIQVVAKMDAIVKNWVKDVVRSKDPSSTNINGKFIPFGSFSLGLRNKGSDIDGLIVAPWKVERSDFFTSFVHLLAKHPEVKINNIIENAFVPVIKILFNGIEVDLVFARLLEKTIPEDIDLSNDRYLKHLDSKYVLSLNGARVTEAIMQLVPNLRTFQEALSAIKYWAKQRGIHSNILGYLGGVSWAILVARICQLYPNASSAVIVIKFFKVYQNCSWYDAVIRLRDQGGQKDSEFTHQEWDRKVNFEERKHLMPILTPAYPMQNSTYNVTNSTLATMKTEIKRGFNVTEEILRGNADWNELFSENVFFPTYKHFLVLKISAKNQDNLYKWKGIVESRIRLLVSDLEKNPTIDLIHVNPKPHQQDSESCQWFFGLTFVKQVKVDLNLTSVIAKFVNKVKSKAIDIFTEDMTIQVEYTTRKDLGKYGVVYPKSPRSDHQPIKRKAEDGQEYGPNKKRG